MSISSFTASSTTSRSRDAGSNDALYQVKLLSALRSGDPAQIHPFLSEISRDRRASVEGEADLGSAALHLAIRCASCDTVTLLLSHRSISPNAVYPPGSGTTALHLAASLPRADVVNILLEQDSINDTLRDSRGKTCLDVAKGKEASRAIKDSRSLLTASYRSLLRAYIFSSLSDQPPASLITLLQSPRIRLVDLSFLDDDSGRSLLHEAARRKDLKMVELAVRAGASVFVRDRRGKTPGDVAGKDDRVKVYLKQFSNQDTTLLDPTAFSSEPPELRGYLNKYANVAKGYSTRYFVLKNGVLSYYHHQEDEQVASRGSIAMRTAVLKTIPGSSGLRFEVQSTPTTRGSHGILKWYIKANHPVEASRWIQALTKSIDWARREAERQSMESEVTSLRASSLKGSITSSTVMRRRHDSNAIELTASSGAESDTRVASPSLEPSPEDDQEQDGDNTETSSIAESENVPPHNTAFDLQGNSTVTQMELLAQLLINLPVTSEGQNTKKSLEDQFNNVHGMMTEYVQMVREREDWWKEKLEKERERQNVWEESLQAVVKEGELMERELRTKSRRRSRAMDASFTTAASEFGTLHPRPSVLVSSPPATAVPATASEPTVSTPPSLPTIPSEKPSNEPASVSASIPTSIPAPIYVPPPITALPAQVTPPLPVTVSNLRKSTIASRRLSSGIVSPGTARPFSILMGAASPARDEESMVDTDEEDEFFDAIEANTLPNLVINESLNGHSTQEMPPTVDLSQYNGYADLRPKLAITSDDRPPMSLWAVLKNSIGKDLTKISFPVFFNEPTSMLQRMAEDMEFSECLDAASAETDAHKRIAFVAAFAMSNYSSTIGRIAKPFNPMLSETFEYVRLDKKYRYMSEQVSHHPPMSACWAEAPAWRYYGEVDAQNKFMGKSFEIRPTGVAHVDLLLPKEQEPSYPEAKGSALAGKVVEHYSWKKVTTNISGFLMGSPTIDHYGDMVVTNHRTGDKCILTFKPRGWRGRDAYEISGYVADSAGNVIYEIAGRWNSQLVARAVGTGSGSLNPDMSLNSGNIAPEFLLLWRNSEKPPAPFNLTPFAITLNDCPEDTLKPYLCPTDCRLRPDQRAFELGKYERANELKNKQEDFQRATRKAREEGKRPPHRPRWFTAETEPDTGERVWSPSRVDDYRLEYWMEREKVWQAKKASKSPSWKDVGRIFIEDSP